MSTTNAGMTTQDMAMLLWELEGSVLDALPMCVALVKRDGVYRLANGRFAELVGHPRSEIEGANTTDVLGPRACLALSSFVAKALRGEEVHVDAEIPYRTGTRRVQGMLGPANEKEGGGYWAAFYEVTP